MPSTAPVLQSKAILYNVDSIGTTGQATPLDE